MGVSQSLKVTQVSQSVAGNTSVIRVVWTSTQSGESYNNNLSTAYYNVTVNGKVSKYSVSYKLTKATTVTILDKTFTVQHDGAGDCTVEVDTWMDTGISAGEITKYKSLTLDTIPRTSTPTVSASSTDMGSKVQIYTNRPSDKLTHDLAYSFAGSDYVTFATNVGDSYVWTTPDLASSIPNATSGTVTIRSTTKSGGTEIGTGTVTMTLKVPTSVVPTISKVNITEATEGLAEWFGFYVQHKSTLDVAITAAGAKGSTISGYKTVIAGAVYTDDSFITNELAAAGAQNVVVTVTDSRGRTASKTISINVQPYEPPKIPEFKVFRCDVDGNPTDDGVYVVVTTTHSVSSLNYSNTALVTLEYKRATDADWTYLDGGDAYLEDSVSFVTEQTFSIDYQYSFRFTVTDWFGTSTSYVAMLSSADVVLDISSDGTGLGIGKVSQRSNATEFARVMYDRHDKRITNGLAIYTGSSSNAIDPDTALEHIILTDKNTPTEAFYYICTYFYADKTDASNKAQMAIPYSGTGGTIYTRHKYNGSWSAWTGGGLSAYPVNSIYISYSHTSPAELFGGTWTRIENRFLWGITSSGTIGATGGAQTHTLTVDEMPSHTHGGVRRAYVGDSGTSSQGQSSGSGDTNTETGPKGGGAPHNNMPPYVNVSIWRRTA